MDRHERNKRRAERWRERYRSDPKFREKEKARKRKYRPKATKKPKPRQKKKPVMVEGVLCITANEVAKRLGESSEYINLLRKNRVFPKGTVIYHNGMGAYVYPDVFVRCLMEHQNHIWVTRDIVEITARMKTAWETWIKNSKKK